jgi:hypothetical protein
MTAITSTPGITKSLYSDVEPAIAPPNRYVNIRTNITGVIVTSSSCSGTCFTFSIPRQPKASADVRALARGGRGVVERAERIAAASASTPGFVVGTVLMPPPPLLPLPPVPRGGP